MRTAAARPTPQETVACRRCECVFTTPGSLIEHKRYAHLLPDELAIREAAEDAAACPSCSRRSGHHNQSCGRKDWKPVGMQWLPRPFDAWTYAMPVLLPLRVAMRAFRRSYLAHVVTAAKGDPDTITKILGLVPRSIYQLAHDEKLTGLGIAGQVRCSRCQQIGHTSRSSRCPNRRRRNRKATP